MNKPADPSPPTPLRLVGFERQDLYKKREKIFTRFVGGRFQRLRFFTGWPLLLGYFGLPWLQFDDRQAVLFDLGARQFHLFGITLWPQDLWLLGVLLMTGAFVLFATTTVVGRLWCGYTCPQTVWTAIFMWIEQITEGSRHQRIRLERAPWSSEKLRKRLSKHALWLGWAALTGLTFVGYFVPVRSLATELVTLQADASAALWVGLFTAATYMNAGWLREQVCIYMCPYARFQSAMIDKDTLVISYDRDRGEPRGSVKQHDAGDVPAGDCIDCTLCVQVCPTGIDIRNGLQYECIGCAHCIDACDQVMHQTGRPAGLISYTTSHRQQQKPHAWLRPRSVGYAVIGLALAVGCAYGLLTRAPIAIDIIRDRGSLYSVLPDGRIGNEMRLRISNKSQRTEQISIRINSEQPLGLIGDHSLTIAANTLRDVPLRLVGNNPRSAAVTLEVCLVPEGRCTRSTTNFFAPSARESAP